LDAWIFEIRPVGVEPRLNLIEHPGSVSAFISTYDQLRAEVRRKVQSAQKLHLFHASPPAIAVASGQHLLAKVDPAVLVYDYRKAEGGFVPVLEVNT
jgi:hypothetical protein